MAKRAPADPDKFDEASKWFRARTPVTKAEWDAMSAKARRQSFTIGGTQQLKVVQTVFDELQKAIDKGTPIDEWRKALKKKLKGDFVDKNSAPLTTAFINANQTAYSTGRYYQLTDPSVTPSLPYWAWDSVLDAATSVICTDLAGTIRPHDDPWWMTHWPPMHHRCRSSVRGLTAAMAKRRGGITKELPRPEIPDEFGLAPPLRAGQIWEPDRQKYDPSAFREYERKQARMKAANDNADKRAADEAKRKAAEDAAKAEQAKVENRGPIALNTPKIKPEIVEKALAAGRELTEVQRIAKGLPSEASSDKSDLLRKVARKHEEAAREWTSNWVANTSRLKAEKAVAGLDTKDSWQQWQYSATQALIERRMPQLLAAGIVDADGYVTLYRGVNGAQAAEIKKLGTNTVDLALHPVSSWSSSKEAADMFAAGGGAGTDGVVLKQKIHYSRAFAMHENEFAPYWDGSKQEREWTIITREKSIKAEVVK